MLRKSYHMRMNQKLLELYSDYIIEMTLANHLDTLRKRLDDTVKTYNQAIGSYNSRLLVTAKKFEEIGGYGDDEIDTIGTIDKSPRMIAQEES